MVRQTSQNSPSFSRAFIYLPFRDCPENQCEGVNLLTYPEDGYDICEAGKIIEEYSCELLSSEYNEECALAHDSDSDGVLDEEDKCSNTVGEQLIYGCSCDQILELKPGEDTATNRQGCSNGILNVFENAIGWAKDLF